ncbi:MAG TPA: methyltransferase domain-containing protein [Thermoanaerobaculia bacterium]
MSRVPRQPADDPLAVVRESLVRNYFTDGAYLASAIGQKDLAAHLDGRAQHNRERVAPWLESFRPLAGARVLEIGCGTGASTLVLAEHGAVVTAVDILEASIRAARDRCRADGYDADFLVANAAEVKRHFPRTSFDVIVFYAALEHMTHEERRAAMRDTWEMLDPGAFWVVIETPNRLWHYDNHTALLPFYHWLPDRVAFEYSRFSEREYFREIYLDHTPEKELHFLRRGRGVSFHEFELFMAPRQQLEVVSCLHAFVRAREPEERQRWIASGDAAFAGQLQRACPDLHEAFVQPALDLAIRKTATS